MKVKKMMREKYPLKRCSRNLKRKKRAVDRTLADDVVDIILDNDKYKEKLLLANAENVKNGRYYNKVIEELKERCSERAEEFPFNVLKPGRSSNVINVCRDAVMRLKTSPNLVLSVSMKIRGWEVGLVNCCIL